MEKLFGVDRGWGGGQMVGTAILGGEEKSWLEAWAGAVGVDLRGMASARFLPLMVLRPVSVGKSEDMQKITIQKSFERSSGPKRELIEAGTLAGTGQTKSGKAKRHWIRFWKGGKKKPKGGLTVSSVSFEKVSEEV